MTPGATLSLVTLFLLLCPVSSETVDPSLEYLIKRNTEFGTRFYQVIASRSDDNVFLSPFILSGGLLALLSAASGPTQDQLLQGLMLAGLEPQTLPDLFQSLRLAVLSGDGARTLLQGIGVFPSQHFAVSSSYQALVPMKFGGYVETVSYTAPEEAINTINRWAQEQTGDRVQELVSKLDFQPQLLIATAASYQTRFRLAFNSSSTQDERFYVDKYHVVMVPMMVRADKYFLAYDRSVKAGVLKLTMADGAAMLIVLPDEDVDVTAVEEEVTAEKILAWIRQLKKTKLEVQLPRFLLERSYSLRDALQTLNITRVFQDDADITNMGEAKGPKLSQVYHKSVISVDESGDDTVVGGGVTTFATPPPRLTFNRPFIFIIYQESTGSLLFIGRVSDPTQK